MGRSMIEEGEIEAALVLLERSNDVRVRDRIAMALCEMQVEEIIPILTKVLPQQRVLGKRSTLIYALGKLERKEAFTPELISVLRHIDETDEGGAGAEAEIILKRILEDEE